MENSFVDIGYRVNCHVGLCIALLQTQRTSQGKK